MIADGNCYQEIMHYSRSRLRTDYAPQEFILQPGRRKKFISPCQTDATSVDRAERRERISRRIYRRVGAVCPVISVKT